MTTISVQDAMLPGDKFLVYNGDNYSISQLERHIAIEHMSNGGGMNSNAIITFLDGPGIYTVGAPDREMSKSIVAKESATVNGMFKIRNIDYTRIDLQVGEVLDMFWNSVQNAWIVKTLPSDFLF